MGKRIANDWAKEHIAALKRGETVSFRPVGGSMKGIIESGDLVQVAPMEAHKADVGGIYLVQVGDFTYLHLVKDVEFDEDGQLKYLIGNNRGGLNGWVYRDAIYGVLVSVNPGQEACDIINEGLRLHERRRLLCMSVPKCPSCGASQIQLIDWSSSPPRWRCRECKTRYHSTPA